MPTVEKPSLVKYWGALYRMVRIVFSAPLSAQTKARFYFGFLYPLSILATDGNRALIYVRNFLCSYQINNEGAIP